jgi:hypothetical protein
MAFGSPLTVAGAAAELHPCRMRTAFPFTSLAGTTGNDACIERQVSQDERIAAVCKPRSAIDIRRCVSFLSRDGVRPALARPTKRGHTENHAEQHLVKLAEAYGTPERSDEMISALHGCDAGRVR